MVPALTAYKKFTELVALLNKDDQKKDHLREEVARKFRLTDKDVRLMLDELKRGEIDR